jgi:hypothetical protein
MAKTIITPTEDHDGNERFNVSVTLDNGETETLEGLYDVESCMRYSHMKVSYFIYQRKGRY